MYFWEKPEACDIDKDTIAETLKAYAKTLENSSAGIPSVVDGIDRGDKPIILKEIMQAANDISSGEVSVAELSLQEAWITTANSLLVQRDAKGYMKYSRAITVAQHIHMALAA